MTLHPIAAVLVVLAWPAAALAQNAADTEDHGVLSYPGVLVEAGAGAGGRHIGFGLASRVKDCPPHRRAIRAIADDCHVARWRSDRMVSPGQLTR
jgi:hypothetical protein